VKSWAILLLFKSCFSTVRFGKKTEGKFEVEASYFDSLDQICAFLASLGVLVIKIWLDSVGVAGVKSFYKSCKNAVILTTTLGFCELLNLMLTTLLSKSLVFASRFLVSADLQTCERVLAIF